MRIRNAILTLVLLFAVFPGRAEDVSLPSIPTRLVNDYAGAFEIWQADSLERALVDFDNSTSNQISVVTLSDLHGRDVAEYALRIANKWGIGSARNNGVLILLKPRGADGYVDVTIQVGRGLEGAITDVYASRIIRNIMGPSLREDRYFKAVSEGCAELMALASGEISEPRDDDMEDDVFVVLALFFFIICIVIILVAISSDGNGGGSSGPIIFHSGGFNGGGFSGGFGGGNFGGGFGGGHGGFGGFGGGSFGGGGASGRF